MKKYLLIFIVIAFIAAVIFKMQDTLATSQPADLMKLAQNQNDIVMPTAVPDLQTFEGEYLCLPQKSANSIQTGTCARGLKLANGSYVALDWYSETASNYELNNRLQVKGIYTPIEEASTSTWQKFTITGIVKTIEVIKL